MLFAVDAGNTNIVLGVFDGPDRLLFTSRVVTDPLMTGDQYAGIIANILSLYNIPREKITDSIVSTVVPALMQSLPAALKLLFKSEPLVLGRGLKSGLKVRGFSPDALGADLVCGAVGALKKYPAPLIVFDFGTATTVSAIDREGVFIGGTIIPGIMISLKALSSTAALLKDVSPNGSISPISLDTAECMRSGSILGAAYMMDGMIQSFRETLGEDAFVVATGGLSSLVVPHCKTAGIVRDDTLLLDGLYEIFALNSNNK